MRRPVDAPISQSFGANPTSTILPGSADYWIIEQFGNYQPDGHTGEDYAVPVGTPIRAVTSGTVIHVGNRGGTYLDNEFWIAPAFAGYHYVINHDPAPGFPNGFIGIYAHGKEVGAKVKAGQRVTEGQVIGLSGNTGGSTGPHLHFEILPDQFVVNSYMYGRVDPEQLFRAGGAAIGAQSESVKPIKEWYDMPIGRADLLAIAAAVNNEDMREKTAAAAAYKVLNAKILSTDGRKWPLSAHIQGNTARTVEALARIAALTELVKQTAAGAGTVIDYAKVEAAAEAGAQKALAEAQDIDVAAIADAVNDEAANRLGGK